MRKTVPNLFGTSALPALVVGALMVLSPVDAMAQRGGGHRGGGGGHVSAGARSFSGGGGARGFSSGQAYVSPRGYSAGRGYSSRGYIGPSYGRSAYRGYYGGGLYLGFGAFGARSS